MPYLSCSSTNQSYGERLSLKEHLISDCYPRMLSCVGNYIQTYDETTQRTSLVWVKFSTYLNLPLKLDIPVTCKQDWHIFPSSKFILWLPTLLDVLLHFLTTPEVQRNINQISREFHHPPPRNYLNISLTTIQALLTIASKPLVHSAPGHLSHLKETSSKTTT